MKVKVRVTFDIEVELIDPPENVAFFIEENGCPGTGPVGSAIEEHIERCSDSRTCWACALGATNRIIEVDGVPYVE